jgi:hypothetical protein
MLLAAGEDPLIEYTPEVMLCNWKEHMSLKGLPEPNSPKGSPKGAKGAAAGASARRTRKARR